MSRVTQEVFKKTLRGIEKKLDCLEVSVKDSYTSVDNRQVEITDTNSWTSPANTKNYFFTVISGTAEVTIGSTTISGVPQGFEGAHGNTTNGEVINPITITGEEVGARIIVYYEL